MAAVNRTNCAEQTRFRRKPINRYTYEQAGEREVMDKFMTTAAGGARAVEIRVL